MQKELNALKADISSFTIEGVHSETERRYLVMRVRYHHPDGRAQEGCTFEGVKVLVFESELKEAILWRQIDPHFRSKTPTSQYEAPSPIARFPGNEEGWNDALLFVNARIRGWRDE